MYICLAAPASEWNMEISHESEPGTGPGFRLLPRAIQNGAIANGHRVRLLISDVGSVRFGVFRVQLRQNCQDCEMSVRCGCPPNTIRLPTFEYHVDRTPGRTHLQSQNMLSLWCNC